MSTLCLRANGGDIHSNSVPFADAKATLSFRASALSDLRATYGPILKIVSTISSEPIWTTKTLNEN